MENTLVDSKHNVNKTICKKIYVINVTEQRQDAKGNQFLSSLKPASITDSKKIDFHIFQDDIDCEDVVGDDEQNVSHQCNDNEDISFQPQAKRSRTSPSKHSTGSARGRHDCHICSKKLGGMLQLQNELQPCLLSEVMSS